MPSSANLRAFPIDEQESQLRQTHVATWIEHQHEAGFGVDQHMADALNAYLDGRFDLSELLTELRRAYLN